MGEAKGIDIATSSVDEIVEACMDDNDLIVTVVDATAGADRRLRQKSAEVIATIASRDAALIAPYSAEMADALSRPEARTRWQILDAFRYLVATDSRATDKALTGAETALYDEQSGPARLAASASSQRTARRRRRGRRRSGPSSTKRSSAITETPSSMTCSSPRSLSRRARSGIPSKRSSLSACRSMPRTRAVRLADARRPSSTPASDLTAYRYDQFTVSRNHEDTCQRMPLGSLLPL